MKNWKVNSWRKYPVKHIPTYGDEKELNNVLNKLKTFPPLVFAGETRHLKDQLSKNHFHHQLQGKHYDLKYILKFIKSKIKCLILNTGMGSG